MNNEEQITAKTLFFEDISKIKSMILMCYKIEPSLVNDFPDELKSNTVFICPQDQVKKLIEIGISKKRIFHIPSSWNKFDILHGKIFIKIYQKELSCMIGSNNFTYAGLERNLETYILLKSQLKKEMALDHICNRQDKKYWSGFLDNSLIEGILDFINHIISASDNCNFLSEELLIDLSKKLFFVHSAGHNSLAQGLKVLCRRKTKKIIRVVTPYTTAESLRFFLSFIYEIIKQPFKLQVLTNYLPDFKTYYDSASYIDPDDYLEIKRQWKSENNVDIELRFWSANGIEHIELPGNFIHSKLYVITLVDGDIAPEGFLLTSANVSSSAWKNQKNVEVGILDVDAKRTKNMYDFTELLWMEAEHDTVEVLNKIKQVRKKIVEREIITQLPLKRFITSKMSPGSKKTTSGAPGGQPSKLPITISIPQVDKLDEFLEKTIHIVTTDFSPSITSIEAEIHFFDITQPLLPPITKVIPLAKIGKQYSMNLSELKKHLTVNHAIDFISIKALTNIVTNDIEIKTKDWEKVLSEDVLNVKDNVISIIDLDRYVLYDTEKIEAIIFTKDAFFTTEIAEKESQYRFQLPKDTNYSQVESIIIRQSKREFAANQLVFYQCDLKFRDKPVKNIQIDNMSMEDTNFPCITIELDETHVIFDPTDFVFIVNGQPVDPVVTKKDGHILTVLLSVLQSEIIISTKSYLHRFFVIPDLTIVYGLTGTQLSSLESIITRYKHEKSLQIKPEILSEDSSVSIVFNQELEEQILLEYMVKNDFIMSFYRPHRTITNKKTTEIPLGTLSSGQVIFVKSYVPTTIGNILLYKTEAKVKNILIKAIRAILPFKNHMRTLESNSWVNFSHFLFSIELEMLTKLDENIAKNIVSARLIYDGTSYNFKKVKSSPFYKDAFFIFFKIQALKEICGSIQLSVNLETTEDYADIKQNIEIFYEKKDDKINFKVNENERFIENGYKDKIYDNFLEVHLYLLEKYVENKPADLYFKQYDWDKTNICLDSRELILPVWFFT